MLRLVQRPCLAQRQWTRSFFSLPLPDLSSRKEYAESRLLNFSQKQVYDVVSNVRDYEQFVPFCNFSRVYSHPEADVKGAKKFQGELGVGFKMFEEKYMSEVTCVDPSFVQAVSADATLFKELVTTWHFRPNVPNKNIASPELHPSCYVDFKIAFEFASPLHAQASNVFFDQVSKAMFQAFVQRCEKVYRA
ncbi:dehydrase and lipid transport-domain-containing protein [Syncephalastrum racemosum]|uniref:Dehydrase and lipid transport-domain-containing protein n=1 Tax=Syncephalastrum racemosum TaxID=13706 RepID=A0A1X2H927_SYNRA|nr:dehydrase and lipid transport-domain-containing protein [Syncephalastrum racemosum]